MSDIALKDLKFAITGCNGFIGTHMANYLLSQGSSVQALVYGDSSSLAPLVNKIELHEFNCVNESQVDDILSKTDADYLIHLAAQSSIPLSWREPRNTIEVNVLGTLNVLEALKKIGFKGRSLVVGAGAEYGFMKQSDPPISEIRDFRPTSFYGVSKIAADMLGYFYANSLGLNVIRVRPFNIIGPGKVGDACSDFARGIAAVELSLQEFVGVGNLNPIRDYLDVRDAVRGMVLAVMHGKVGETYNICSGKGYQIRELLQMLTQLSSAKVSIIEDKGKLRPVDEPIEVGDNYNLQQLGWRVVIPIAETLKDILAFWREKLKKENV